MKQAVASLLGEFYLQSIYFDGAGDKIKLAKQLV